MITRKERISNAKARLVVLNGILDADVNVQAMPHGWTKDTAVAWQQKRNIEKYLRNMIGMEGLSPMGSTSVGLTASMRRR